MQLYGRERSADRIILDQRPSDDLAHTARILITWRLIGTISFKRGTCQQLWHRKRLRDLTQASCGVFYQCRPRFLLLLIAVVARIRHQTLPSSRHSGDAMLPAQSVLFWR